MVKIKEVFFTVLDLIYLTVLLLHLVLEENIFPLDHAYIIFQ